MLESGSVASNSGLKQARSRRRARLAAGLWLAFGVIAWNNVFDREIRSAQRGYLDAQGEHHLGTGPAVTMRGVMEPAARAAARRATLWSGVPTAAGLVAVYLVTRRTHQ
jgi:hypothetical protein